jgi:uncharacterized protein
MAAVVSPRLGIAARLLVGAVALYRVTLAAVVGGRCRFEPSCSIYAQEALRAHGAVRGSALTLKRLGRCHPWGGQGLDPVPR